MSLYSLGPTMTAPLLTTIKALFARSRNRCAFPDCSVPLTEESDTVTAEICHIRALSPRGPRYDRNQTPEERNSAANLVLMCGRGITRLSIIKAHMTFSVVGRMVVLMTGR